MGNLKKDIYELASRHEARGVNPGKIAKRLIEQGLEVLDDQGELTPNTRIIPNFEDDQDFAGTFHVAQRREASVPLFNGARESALRFGAELFDGYARHHLAKIEEGPERVDKAQRNIEAAARMYEALGEDYTPPSFELKPLPTPAEWAVRPDSSPVQPDSAPERAGTAKRLLSDLHIAEAAGQPTLGVRVHVEDQPIMATLVELGFLNRDDVTDKVIVTTKGKDFIGVRPDGVPDLPVALAEVTGNIAESEIAARYVEGKVRGVEKWIGANPGHANRHDYEIMARVLAEIANEFRMGLHLPTVALEGRIIPYNEDRSTGMMHGDLLQAFFDDCYARNLKAGWWTNIEDGTPKKRNVGELFMLMVTELAEAYSAYCMGDMDDKLPQYPGVGVEIGDLLIRVGDFCGALAAGNVIEWDNGSHNPGAEMFMEVLAIAERYEAIRKTPAAVGDTETGDFLPAAFVGVMVDAKLAFNAKREDHKIENRLKEDGKRT